MAPDVFISYAREDRAVAQSLADAFAAKGWAVWWDREIRGGTAFATEIERALAASRVVVVLWSEAAVASDFVRDEARRAMRAGKLLPVRIADVEPPLGFGETHTLDLLEWDGSPGVPALGEVVHQVAERVSGQRMAVAPGHGLVGSSRSRLGLGAAVVVVVAAVAGALYWYASPRDDGPAGACAPPSASPVWKALDEGYALFQSGDLAKARSTFNRILADDAAFARARFYLAQVLIQTGEEADAKAILAKVLDQTAGGASCALDAGELRKMRDWHASLASAPDEPAALPQRVAAVTEPPPKLGPSGNQGDGVEPAGPPVFRPAFGAGDKPRDRIPPPDEGALRAAVDATFGTDRDRRIGATTGLIADVAAVSDAVPVALARAEEVQAKTRPANLDERSGVINALVLLQSATPATLNANRAAIETLLAKARDTGEQTAAQADRVAAALRKAEGRKPVAYVQIASESQRALADALATRLRSVGYEVPAFEVVGDRAPKGTSEIRIHGRSDRELARWMTQAMVKLEVGDVRPVSLRRVNAENDTFEIWFSRELCEEGVARPKACEG